MARRTHKMIGANDSVRGNGVPTQANSITVPCIKLFAPCEEALPATEITDIINTTDFITASASCGGACTLTAGQDSYSIRTGSAPPDNAINGAPGTWIDPAGDDWIFFTVIAPTDEGLSRACYIESSGDSGKGALAVFPYRCNFIYISAPAVLAECKDLSGNYTISQTNSWNCDYCAGFNFEDGEIHTVAGVRRGDWLEHYVDEALVGRINVYDVSVEKDSPELYAAWLAFDGGHGMELTHSGYSGGGCGVTDYTQHARADWYGVSQFVFTDGLPSQDSIETGMAYMKDKWSQGDKIIYPEWITL